MWKPIGLIATGLLTTMFTFGTAAQKPQTKQTRVPASQNKADVAALDGEVLEVVLIDLLTCKESPVESGEGGIRAEILFSDAPCNGEPEVKALLRIHDEAQFKALSKKQLGEMKESADNMVQRSKEKPTFKAFKPKNKPISIHTKEDRAKKVDERRFERPQVFSAFVPGYSKDKKFAIVWLTFPWSEHHGDATYLLENVDGPWIVRVRDIRIYP